MQFPTLYKKNSDGSLQQWTIAVIENVITRTYGQVGGAMQTTSDTIREGKSIGKKNATTPVEQALKEALAEHTKKLKKGYVTTQAAAQAGEVDDVIEGGVLPMLAQELGEREHTVTYPVYGQPKLDGHRVSAIIDVKSWLSFGTVNNGPLDEQANSGPVTNYTSVKVSMWTRSRKRHKSMPHVEEQLQRLVEEFIDSPHGQSEDTRLLSAGFQKVGERQWRLVLDGEGYNHEYKNRFEELTSLLRKEGADGYQDIQYHIYDMVVPFGFNQRLSFLDQLLPKDVKHLRRVPTAILNNRAEIDAQHDDYVSQGYEGLMIRIGNTPYEEGHRSDQLLKFKRWRESEFKVIDLKEGRGRLQGCAICVCEIILPSGEKAEFSAKMEGESTHLRAAWENPELWIGKMMTVKYQGLTKTGKPRFPTGLRLREDL